MARRYGVQNTTPPVMIVRYVRTGGWANIPIFFRLTPDREQTARVGQVHRASPDTTPCRPCKNASPIGTEYGTIDPLLMLWPSPAPSVSPQPCRRHAGKNSHPSSPDSSMNDGSIIIRHSGRRRFLIVTVTVPWSSRWCIPSRSTQSMPHHLTPRANELLIRWETPTGSRSSSPMKVSVMSPSCPTAPFRRGRSPVLGGRMMLMDDEPERNSQPQPLPIAAGRGERCLWEGAHRRAQRLRFDLCLEIYPQRWRSAITRRTPHPIPRLPPASMLTRNPSGPVRERPEHHPGTKDAGTSESSLSVQPAIQLSGYWVSVRRGPRFPEPGSGEGRAESGALMGMTGTSWWIWWTAGTCAFIFHGKRLRRRPSGFGWPSSAVPCDTFISRASSIGTWSPTTSCSTRKDICISPILCVSHGGWSSTGADGRQNVASEFRPDKKLHSKSGTLAYLAPEVYGGGGYLSEVDWWSLGVVFYECIYNKVGTDSAPRRAARTADPGRSDPFRRRDMTSSKRKSGKAPPITPSRSRRCRCRVCTPSARCWRKTSGNASARPGSTPSPTIPFSGPSIFRRWSGKRSRPSSSPRARKPTSTPPTIWKSCSWRKRPWRPGRGGRSPGARWRKTRRRRRSGRTNCIGWSRPCSSPLTTPRWGEQTTPFSPPYPAPLGGRAG